MSILGLESLFSQKVALLDVIDEEGSSGAEFFKHLVWQVSSGPTKAESVFRDHTGSPVFVFKFYPYTKFLLSLVDFLGLISYTPY